ncbi:MAG: hypothetical protein WCE79_27495 [Xanthobacteraceae bacterium]
MIASRFQSGTLVRATATAGVVFIAFLAAFPPANAFRVDGTITIEMQSETSVPPGPRVITSEHSSTKVTVFHKIEKVTAVYKFAHNTFNFAMSGPGWIKGTELSPSLRYEQTKEDQRESASQRTCARDWPNLVMRNFHETSKDTIKIAYDGDGIQGVGPIRPFELLPPFSGAVPSSGPIPLELKVMLSALPKSDGRGNRTSDAEGTDCPGPYNFHQESTFASNEPRAPLVTFTLPDTFQPPFNGKIEIRKSFNPNGLRNPSIDTGGWEIKRVEFDLTIGLPAANPMIITLDPKRGDLVTFDASGSQGDFDNARWEITGEKENCQNPTVMTGSGIEGIVNDFMKNPIDWMAPEKRFGFVARAPNQVDRLAFTTPLLCNVEAKLSVSEGPHIRDEATVKIEVMPRERWDTTVHYKGIREIQKFTTQPDLARPPVTVTMAQRLLTGKTVALTQLELCLDNDTVFGGPNSCVTYLTKTETGARKFADKLEYTYVLREGQSKSALASVFEELTGRSGAHQDAPSGPFSGMYYFQRIDDTVLDTIAVFASFLKSPQDDALKECIELHEYLHGLLKSRYFGAARGETTLPESLRPLVSYDPLRIIEQMYDSRLDRLIKRAARTLAVAWALEPGDHARFHEWRDWVQASDEFKHKPVRGELARVEATTLTKREPPYIINCGAENSVEITP